MNETGPKLRCWWMKSVNIKFPIKRLNPPLLRLAGWAAQAQFNNVLDIKACHKNTFDPVFALQYYPTILTPTPQLTPAYPQHHPPRLCSGQPRLN